MKRIFLFIQICLFISISEVHSQKTSLEIGGKLINELADWKSYGPGVGLQTIFIITKHSGIETGLYYKINPKYYLFSEGPGNYSNKKFNEKTILIPLLYRFESRCINFTTGLAVDYLINQKERERNPPLGMIKDDFGRVELISTISISKNFYLNESLVFEPEIRASAFVPAGGGGVGLNLSLRKKLF